MSTSLTRDLAAQLQGAPAAQLAQRLGIDPAQAGAAISAALPLLLGALGRNASQPRGARSLYGALEQDHAGMDLAGALGSVLGGGGQGGQILDHIFGQRQPRAAQGLGQVTGLGSSTAGSLLRMLAPIVMAYLAKRMVQPRQAAGGPEALSRTLEQEHARVTQDPGAGGLLGAVLDRDGDGDVDFRDLLSAGGSLLGAAGRP